MLSWIAVRAVLGWSAVWKWLSARSLAEIGVLTLCLALAIDHIALIASHRHAAHLQAQLIAETKAREADRQAYAKAQADAAAKNKAQVAQAKQQQQEISDAQVSTLQSRLELIASELRKQSATPQSHPGSSSPGNPGAAPCTVTDPAWMCLSPSDRLSAAQSEERHDELIDWVLKQSKLDPNTGASR